MKKIITLLLALTMICTFLPMMASASSAVSYDFEVVTYYESDDYDTWEEEGWFGLNISVSGDEISAGLLSFAYDVNKLTPGVMGRKSFTAATTAAEAVDTFSASSVGTIVGDGYLDATNGIISFSYYIGASDVANENVIFAIGFAPVDESAALDSLADAIYPITKADSAAVEALYTASPAAAEYDGIGCSSATGVYSAKDNNIVVNLGEEPAEDEWKKDEESTVGTVTFPATLNEDGSVATEAASGARTQIAVFGKNVTGHELADGDYWVQFNENKYLGKASEGVVTAWAIVIVDTTGEKMEAGREYSYTAGCGEQSWTGTVTVAEIAE